MVVSASLGSPPEDGGTVGGPPLLNQRSVGNEVGKTLLLKRPTRGWRDSGRQIPIAMTVALGHNRNAMLCMSNAKGHIHDERGLPSVSNMWVCPQRYTRQLASDWKSTPYEM